jgi:hypothetical protein
MRFCPFVAGAPPNVRVGANAPMPHFVGTWRVRIENLIGYAL